MSFVPLIMTLVELVRRRGCRLPLSARAVLLRMLLLRVRKEKSLLCERAWCVACRGISPL